MATKAIVTKVNDKLKKLTHKEKIKVLQDARKLLLDPAKWTKGDWIEVYDKNEELISSDNFAYLPSNDENIRMCVMGAVAYAAGCNDQSQYGAMNKIASCSLASVMLEALPPTDQISYGYVEEEYLDHHYYDDYVDYVEPFDVYLERRKISHIDYYVELKEAKALEQVYVYNDSISRKHEDIIELLDRAIANLEAKVTKSA